MVRVALQVGLGFQELPGHKPLGISPLAMLGECCLGTTISTGQKCAPEAGTGTRDGHTSCKTSFSVCSPVTKRLVACGWPGSHPCP